MAQLLCFRIQIVHNKQEEKHLEVCLTRNQQLQELDELGKDEELGKHCWKAVTPCYASRNIL